jgi:drug/metabolite transporter (DMT)-like permease
MRLKQWGMFWLLGILWGSAFFWIKIGLRGTNPFMLVALRLAVGIVGLAFIVAIRKPDFPRQRSLWIKLALLGTFNTAIPFLMITWGQQSIDSAVASILNGTVPLFTILIAHIYLEDEKITLPRIIGLLAGFAGVVLLLGRDLDIGGLSNVFLGQMLVLLAALSYAGSAVFARRYLREVEPLLQAFIAVIFADVLVWLAVPAVESPIRFPSSGETWFAIIWLGLLCTFIAYILYYSLIQSIGSTKTTLVTYVVPVVGLILGVLFLGETFDLQLAFGSLLIIAGIAIVNWEPRRTRTKLASD